MKKFFFVVPLAIITFSIFVMCYSYFNKTINSQIVLRNVTAILFAFGVLFFYQFYKIKNLVYISCFLLFMCIFLSFACLFLFNSIQFSSIFFIPASIYFMYKTGEYLFNANDVLFLEIMTKIVFFTEVFKYALADIYNTEGNYYKSIKILKNCRKNDSYFLLANNYEKINKYEKAAESYTKILLNDKNERPDVLYNRGANYKYLGKYDEAINDFIACIKCRKPDPKAYIALGVIKDELGEYEEAKEYFLKGKVLDNSFNGYIPEKYRSVN